MISQKRVSKVGEKETPMSAAGGAKRVLTGG
jgi:hypothetical protein